MELINIFVLLILFILINSDLMINTFLSNIPGVINPDTNNTTTVGELVQGVILVIAYCIISFLIDLSYESSDIGINNRKY